MSACFRCASDEELECVVRGDTVAEISESMISSHEEVMISSACSLELTTSTSDGLSDKENVVRLLKQHVNSASNRLSNTVRFTFSSQGWFYGEIAGLSRPTPLRGLAPK